MLNRVGGPPIGIVLQANKRDLPDAVSLQQLRGMLDDLELRSAVIESVATEGSGIRETFVFAVRLALDRVRELMRSGALVTAQPKINSAEDLLKEMQSAESGALDMATESGELTHTRMQDVQQASLASQAFQEAMQANVDAPVSEPIASEPRIDTTSDAERVPAAPDAKVASGMVWPPVDGRLILHETSSGQANLHRDSQGGWTGAIDNRWCLHSAADAVFDNIDTGRAELVQWAGSTSPAASCCRNSGASCWPPTDRAVTDYGKSSASSLPCEHRWRMRCAATPAESPVHCWRWRAPT